MSKVEIVNEPKLIAYSLVRGGEGGEETVGIYWNWKDAFDAFWNDCLSNWGSEFDEVFKKLDNPPPYLTPGGYFHKLFSDFFTFKNNDNIDRMIYLWNGSDTFPQELQGKFSSTWWWITKHHLSMPSNLTEKEHSKSNP